MDLVEQQHKGIFSVLDEACMNVGKVTDELFLQGLNGKLAKHAHYTSRKVGNATHNSGKKNPMKPLTWGLTVLTSLYCIDSVVLENTVPALEFEIWCR